MDAAEAQKLARRDDELHPDLGVVAPCLQSGVYFPWLIGIATSLMCWTWPLGSGTSPYTM